MPLPPINADDYRYPGPKPQTKEAGLVMLADVVEAACRSLTEPTPARIQGMVNKLINNIFSDGQLDECELTLKGPPPDSQALQPNPGDYTSQADRVSRVKWKG